MSPLPTPWYRITQLLISLLFFINCDNNLVVIHPEINEQIVVISLLCPAFEQQEVYVGKAAPEMAPSEISGARVKIQGPGSEYLLKEIQPGLYRDSGTINVIAGEKYHLVVQTPDGKTARATTWVPGFFEIVNIGPGDTLDQVMVFSGAPDYTWSQSTPQVEYSSSAGALVYQLLFSLKDSLLSPARTPLTLATCCDFPYFDPVQSNINNLSLVSPARLVVFAWDSVYSNYASHWALKGGMPFYDRTNSMQQFFNNRNYQELPVLSNIEGGLGVFGSANSTTVEFFLNYKREINY